jgi:predicted GH43/DUF377 family glycosyl hydrolase
MAVDCPFVFFHQEQYHMLHVGFDGTGYQTALASSKDLLSWSHEAILFTENHEPRWDSTNIAGTWILKSDDLFERPTLRKFAGRYWMIYHSYPQKGYEAGPAEIGLAWCEDEDLLSWQRLEKPILSWKEGSDWEKGGLYKASLIEDKGIFYMFYNAKDSDQWPWTEQIGVACSTDMVSWKRSSMNPVVKVTTNAWDSQFVADPFVVRDGNMWVMFFYGFNGINAQEGIAFSKNLTKWDKHDQPILFKGIEGTIDEIHAHKPALVWKDDCLYHFYCAVRRHHETDISENIDLTGNNTSEYRCISVATSKGEGWKCDK